MAKRKIRTKTYKDLTLLQKAFVSAYTGNVKETAALANISYDYARQIHTLPHIKEAIRIKHNAEFKPLILNRQQRQAFWSKTVEDTSQLMSDRLRASELLGRSEADFTDNLQVDRGIKIGELAELQLKQSKRIASILIEDHKNGLNPLLPSGERPVDNAITTEFEKT